MCGPLNDWPVIALALGLLVQFTPALTAATLCVDLNSTNPITPYADWSTAATNIQDAIDAATDSDTVLVNDGVYATGGRVMAGDLTNRVALNKALTVQSVNGAVVTTIQGAYTPSTGYGASSVRCAWLTNGASLRGFTLLSGATRSTGSLTTLASGGGAWCASNTSMVADCIIISNKALYYGGGAYQGTFSNCLFLTNAAGNSGGGAYSAALSGCRVISNTAYNGGGAYGGTLRSCFFSGNSTATGSGGGGVASATLYNCTLIRNSALNGGGVDGSSLTNCIVYFNIGKPYTNYSSSLFAYSCSSPLPSGQGNMALDPQLLGDGMHLANSSPCRGTGTNSVVSGVDIDGQPWANPPSMGCVEWQPAPKVGAPPLVQFSPSRAGFAVGVLPAGTEPFVCWWFRNGAPIEDGGLYSSAHTTNLTCNALGELVSGIYQVVVSNAFGVTTSAVSQVAAHCADAGSTNPVPPFSTWATAATTIQDAITAAVPGDWVLVTNGVYASGGKSMDGTITNRVTLDKAVTVLSIAGAGGTIIQGSWGTNGPSGVRCAWLTNGAVLCGFTLCGGATRAIGNPPNDSMSGGGVWGSSTSASVLNCMILTNLAGNDGGGAYRAGLFNCTLAGNRAVGSGQAGVGIGDAGSGGGASGCNLTNCVITGNFADQSYGGGAYSCNLYGCALTKNSSYMYGGAAYRGTLLNCSVSGNISAGYGGYGGAVASATLINCIVYANTLRGSGFTQTNYYGCTMAYCDSDPLPAGTGNVDVDPQSLSDGFHVSPSSPCRGEGLNAGVVTDIDGQAWANPPSMGCDEWQPGAVVAGQPQLLIGAGNRSLRFSGGAGGEAPFGWWWSHNGSLLQDGPHYSGAGASNLVVNRFDAPDAGIYQFVVSNAFGMATSQVAQVIIHCVDAAATNPVPAYATWDVAAMAIQDAISAAAPGEIVLVNDGVYATGGKVMSADVTNRVGLDKALTVLSMNGYGPTVIQGAYDPLSGTTGPAAVRCAWLTDGATLAGFTLQGGATRTYASGMYGNASFAGGAVYCTTGTAVVANCLIRNNTGSLVAGAVYQGTIVNCAINKNTISFSGSFYMGGTPAGIIYSATLINCTVIGNSFPGYDLHSYCGGLCLGTAKNSIIWGNSAWQYPNYYSITATNCDVTPALSGSGNITNDPLLVDTLHILATSPCSGAGSAAYATGVDVDGEAWSGFPSIGCDEPLASGLAGPLSVSLVLVNTNLYANHAYNLSGQITGRVEWLVWDFGDGTITTNAGMSTSHVWAVAGTHDLVLTAYNVDNPDGVSASVLLNLMPLLQPALTAVSRTTNGFLLQFPVQSNLYYIIQRTTSLTPPIAWQTLRYSTTNTDGMLPFLDSTATGSRQFYRVQVQ